MRDAVAFCRLDGDYELQPAEPRVRRHRSGVDPMDSHGTATLSRCSCDCLSGRPRLTQQERMTYCNKEAGAKKLAGDGR